MIVRSLLLIAAVVFLMLAAFDVTNSDVNFAWLGIALWAASFLPFEEYTTVYTGRRRVVERVE
jgi:hypothetical protein